MVGIVRGVRPKLVIRPGLSRMDRSPQWGGSSERNNTPESGALPATFNVKTRENILFHTGGSIVNRDQPLRNRMPGHARLRRSRKRWAVHF